jgi:glycosyltransferase involved in cell wall biosynthesis
MFDELMAFSKITQFKVILLRSPSSFYYDDLQKLRENGVDVLIKPFKYNYLLKKILFIAPFLIKNVNKFASGYNFVVGFKSILWFLKLDLNHFTQQSLSIHAQFATQASVVALMVKQFHKANTQYSFTFHAYDIYFDNKWFSLLVNESENAFSISQYNIDYITANYKKLNMKKIKLSRLGVFRPKEIARVENDIFTVGLMSWFVPKKGIKYLLDAIKKISEETQIKLILAGDGPLKKNIIKYIKTYSLEKSIQYIGKIKGKQKEDFFNSLDVFVLPSTSLPTDQDGIPVVLMEAISYGLPIISTDISGIPEICRNNYNGYLIPQKNVDLLAEALAKLKNDDAIRDKFGKSSLELSIKYDIIHNSKTKLEELNWIAQYH